MRRNEGIVNVDRGFSLIELLVAMAVLSMTLAVMFTVVFEGTYSILVSGSYSGSSARGKIVSRSGLQKLPKHASNRNAKS